LFNNDFRFVPGTESTWAFTGATAGLQGVNSSFDDCASFTLQPNTDTAQYLAESWVNDSTGWAGGFVLNGLGGMYKFNSVLALKADFSSPDTVIGVLDSAHFVNNSVGSPATYLWTFQNGQPSTSTLKTPPPIMYLQQGHWDVTLRVTTNLGVTSLTKPGYIFVDHGVGINDHSKFSVSVYPNPVQDILNINSTGDMQEIQVINMVGEVMINQKLNTKTITMNTSALKAGIYTAKIKMADGSIYKKIVVN
jgi:hypothetical protein